MYSIIGLLFGKCLSYFTKEEILKGKRYFNILEKSFLLIVLGVLLLKANIIGVVIGLVLGYFLRSIIFIGLGAFASMFVSIEYSLLVNSFVFLYLLTYSRELKWVKVIENIGLFIAPVVLIFFGESFINGNLGILIGIAFGGPVAQLGRTFFK
jgi:hypothetical protein